MNNEYIIVNKTAIEKRIEELQKVETQQVGNLNGYIAHGEARALRDILLSQSTPLIPEIEKAFDASKITTGMNQRNQFAYKYKNSKDYVTNLKLDI